VSRRWSPIPASLDYDDAVAAAQRHVAEDTADPAVRPESRTILLSHGRRTARSVLLLHGYTADPDEMAQLAERFFERGYNVYVPREPQHGLVEAASHRRVTARGLVAFADEAATITAALGDEFGVVGQSGGATLTVWLIEYRPDVRRALLLSPFFRPSRRQAAPFLIKPMTLLWGRRILPDRRTGSEMYYSAVAQYLRIAATFRARPTSPALTHLAVVTSPGDDHIDLVAARAIPQLIADVNGLRLERYEIPAELGVLHSVVRPAAIGPHADALYTRYVSLYEGAPAAL
jgi:alpha-beta hydrolase superfamily lysophospholipase